jgi:hypothetical protein
MGPFSQLISHNILRCEAGENGHEHVSYHGDRRSDAHFPPVVSKCGGPAMMMVIQDLMRCEMDAPEQTLVSVRRAIAISLRRCPNVYF